jgi:hypothetical protein
MKTYYTFLLTFLTSIMAFGQTDTTQIEGLEGRSLELTVGPKGPKAVVSNPYDTANTKNGNDTIRINTKKKKITIITEAKKWVKLEGEAREDSIAEAKRERKNELARWAGIDFGFNNFADADGNVNLSGDNEFMELEGGKSRFFAINFMEQKYEFGTPYFGLLTGLGVEFVSYKFKNNMTLGYTSDTTFALMTTPDSTGATSFIQREGLDKNKLRQIGLRIPLLLEFNTSKRKSRSFHLAVGAVGTLYFDTMYKQKFSVDGKRSKLREKGHFNLSPYRLAATARFGYGGLNLFVEASLTELFEQGEGPELYPFNVGLTLVSF